MQSYPVFFHEADDIIKFVDTVNHFNCDIDLKCGSYLVDAKSLISAFTLSGSRNIEMLIHDENCAPVVNSVQAYLQ